MSVLLNEIRIFPQGDGPDVPLRVFGDEFYSRYENIDGFTVVYDKALDKFCYAVSPTFMTMGRKKEMATLIQAKVWVDIV